MTDQDNNVTEISKVTIGNRLKVARESRKLSVTQVADKLHYHERWVNNLESDNYKEFTAVAYAKGYLRAYAKLLELPADEIIKDLDDYNLDYVIESRRPELIQTRQASVRDRPVRWVTYSIGGILTLLVIIWINSLYNPEQKPATANILQAQSTEGAHTEVF